MLKQYFDSIAEKLTRQCAEHYRERLVSVVLFGSVARGTMRPDSDIDLLLVVEDLPSGRMARVGEFSSVEQALGPALQQAARAGVHTSLSPVFKTPAETRHGSPLFLDMTEEAVILYDRDDFFTKYLDGLRLRMRALGSRRVYSHGGYYWLLKPDLKPGEEIVL